MSLYRFANTLVIAVTLAGVLALFTYNATSEADDLFETMVPGDVGVLGSLLRQLTRPRNEPHECGMSFSYPQYTLVSEGTVDDPPDNAAKGDIEPASGVDPLASTTSVADPKRVVQRGPRTPTSELPVAGFQLLEFTDNTADGAVKGGLYASSQSRHNHRDIPVLYVPGNSGSFYDSRGLGRHLAHQVMRQSTRVGLGMLAAARDGEEPVATGLQIASGRGLSSFLNTTSSNVRSEGLNRLCRRHCGDSPPPSPLCLLRCLMITRRRASINGAEISGRGSSPATMLGGALYSVGMRELFLAHKGALVMKAAAQVAGHAAYLRRQFMLFHCRELSGVVVDPRLDEACAPFIGRGRVPKDHLRPEYEVSVLTHLQRQLCAGTSDKDLYRHPLATEGDRSRGASPSFRLMRRLLEAPGDDLDLPSYGGPHPLSPKESICAHFISTFLEESSGLDPTLVSATKGPYFRFSARWGSSVTVVARQVADEVVRFHDRGLWLVGHSLGGTVARMGALLALAKGGSGSLVAGVVTLSASNVLPPFVSDSATKEVYSLLHGVGDGATTYARSSNGSVFPRLPFVSFQGGPTDALVYSPAASMSAEHLMVAASVGAEPSRVNRILNVPHHQLRGCGVGTSHNGVVYCKQSLSVDDWLLRLMSFTNSVETLPENALHSMILPPSRDRAGGIVWRELTLRGAVVMIATNLAASWIQRHLSGIRVGSTLVRPLMVVDVPFRTHNDSGFEGRDAYDGPTHDRLDADALLYSCPCFSGMDSLEVDIGGVADLCFSANEGLAGCNYDFSAEPFLSKGRAPAVSIRAVVVFKVEVSASHILGDLVGTTLPPPGSRFRVHDIDRLQFLQRSFIPGTMLHPQRLHRLQLRSSLDCADDSKGSLSSVLQALSSLNDVRIATALREVRPPVPSPLLVISAKDVVEGHLPASLRVFLVPNTPSSASQDDETVQETLNRIDAAMGAGYSRRCVVANGSSLTSFKRRFIRDQLPLHPHQPAYSDLPMMAVSLRPFPPLLLDEVEDVSSDALVFLSTLPPWAAAVEDSYLRLLRTVHLVTSFQTAPLLATGTLAYLLVSTAASGTSRLFSLRQMLPIVALLPLWTRGDRSLWQFSSLSSTWVWFGGLYLPLSLDAAEAILAPLVGGAVLAAVCSRIQSKVLWCVARAVMWFPRIPLPPRYIFPTLVAVTALSDLVLPQPLVFDNCAIPSLLIMLCWLTEGVRRRCVLLSSPRKLGFAADVGIYMAELLFVATVGFMSLRNYFLAASAAVMSSRLELVPIRGSPPGLPLWDILVTMVTGRTDGVAHWASRLFSDDGGPVQQAPFRMMPALEGPPTAEELVALILVSALLVIVQHVPSDRPSTRLPCVAEACLVCLFVAVELSAPTTSLLLVPIDTPFRFLWRGIPMLFFFVLAYL